MINPIQLLLSCFGYVKIPIEVVQLSMFQEEVFKVCIKRLEYYGCQAKGYQKALETQRAITAFLRSGRLLTCTK